MFKTEAILASKLWILEFTTVDLINIIATIVLSKSSENIFNENRRHIQWDIDTVIKCENRSISATSSIFCMRNIETTIETTSFPAWFSIWNSNVPEKLMSIDLVENVWKQNYKLKPVSTLHFGIIWLQKNSKENQSIRHGSRI